MDIIQDTSLRCNERAIALPTQPPKGDQILETEMEPKQHNAGYDLVENLTANINSLANLDLGNIGSNMNLQHLLRATNHLKIAQNEFELAKKQLQQK